MTMTIKDFTTNGLAALDFQSELTSDFDIDYQYWRALADAQPGDVRRDIQRQARILVEDILARAHRTGFLLPARIVTLRPDERGVGQPPIEIPDYLRGYWVGSWISNLFKVDLRLQVRNRFTELESDPDPRIVIAAGVLRLQIVESLIAHVAALNMEDHAVNSSGLQPSTLAEVEHAEASLRRLLGCIEVLHTAQALAAYIVAAPGYRQQHHSIVSCLITQGNTLARAEIGVMIEKLHRRLAGHGLDRGFDLSLPYFDEHWLEIRRRTFQVIPAGRIGFTPAFLVRAIHEEQIKVLRDKTLGPLTREHLLEELEMLARAFESKNEHPSLES
jgi:hypothetical protein